MTPEQDAPLDAHGRPRRAGPIGGDIAAIVWGLSRRARLPFLTERYDQVWVMGVFSLVNGLVSIAIMSAAAWLTNEPFIFPSLGPTAFLFFYTPTAPTASPRNALGGHLVGVLAGYLALVVFGLTDMGPAFAGGFTAARVGATALSLGLTSGVMVWSRVPHPPAGATTLIISLGILHRPGQLLILMVAVGLLTLQAIVINRLAGLDYPAWAPRTSSA